MRSVGEGMAGTLSRGYEWGRLALFSLTAGGYAFLVMLLWAGWQMGKFGLPGGDYIGYELAGKALRNGADPYAAVVFTSSFFYAPPLAAVSAFLSYLPSVAGHGVILALDAWALWYMGRGWRGAGMLCWFPLIPFELASGNINLPIAAAIVAGIRGVGWPAALALLAKLSPVLALDRRGLRSFAIAAALAFLLALPWAYLWPEWISHGLRAAGTPGVGPQIPIGFLPRLIVGLVLVATHRPSLRALGSVIAIPAFYWGSLVLFVAPLAILLDSVQSRSSASSTLTTSLRPSASSLR